MSVNNLSGSDRDNAQPRTGHGAASVIPRLNEQISRPELPALEEGLDDAQAREAPRSEGPLAAPAGKPVP
ncbi:MAG: hypothetical protein Q8R01_04510 [Ramlibacter sp.]|nr:hypothetical protein [Ramlibacter sp.]